MDRIGLVGPGWYVQVTPTMSWSWNLDGLPAGDEWYSVARRAHHAAGEG